MIRYKIQVYKNHDRQSFAPYVVKHGAMKALHWLLWEIDIYDMRKILQGRKERLGRYNSF